MHKGNLRNDRRIIIIIIHFSKMFLDCGSTLTDTYGSFTTPGYPNSFPGPVECTWFIEGSAGEVISLDMKKFELGNRKSCGRGILH